MIASSIQAIFLLIPRDDNGFTLALQRNIWAHYANKEQSVG